MTVYTAYMPNSFNNSPCPPSSWLEAWRFGWLAGGLERAKCGEECLGQRLSGQPGSKGDERTDSPFSVVLGPRDMA